jgi:hypothetical protein
MAPADDGVDKSLGALRKLIPAAIKVYEDALKGKLDGEGKPISPDRRKAAEGLLKKFGYLDREEGDEKTRFDKMTDQEVIDRLLDMAGIKERFEAFRMPEALKDDGYAAPMENIKFGFGADTGNSNAGIPEPDGGRREQDSEALPILPSQVRAGEALAQRGPAQPVDTGEARVAI